MCAWVLRLLSLDCVYFGASNPRFGGNGSVLGLHMPLSDSSTPLQQQSYQAFSGLLGQEAIRILKGFYGQENTNGEPLRTVSRHLTRISSPGQEEVQNRPVRPPAMKVVPQPKRGAWQELFINVHQCRPFSIV